MAPIPGIDQNPNWAEVEITYNDGQPVIEGSKKLWLGGEGLRDRVKAAFESGREGAVRELIFETRENGITVLREGIRLMSLVTKIPKTIGFDLNLQPEHRRALQAGYAWRTPEVGRNASGRFIFQFGYSPESGGGYTHRAGDFVFRNLEDAEAEQNGIYCPFSPPLLERERYYE